jgi:alanyl-tRNA synthetase
MLAGLRKVLGDDVYQKGSNITAERLRFDFTHKEKMTSEQLALVENFVNDIIKKDLPVACEEMTLDKARELNAMGVFESKYGEKVKVYTVGQGNEIASREICGGPHVEHTGVMGHFKIVKEESSSSGVRRIKAILENNN